ncbi:hypothetical protein [Spongiactinospora rosea]|uniref:hypothetical protein n=1 Tax=Spongiactinospora rosea TaxID=2248750 RepID=UPI001314DB90|nr:hypothetical protein [Spongiactinospora rosea]
MVLGVERPRRHGELAGLRRFVLSAGLDAGSGTLRALPSAGRSPPGAPFPAVVRGIPR